MTTKLELCRSCLESSDCDKMYNLEEPIINVDVSIATMLEHCISSELDPSGYLPRLVCLQCFKTIRIAYLFLLRFHETQAKIHKLLKDTAPEIESNVLNNELSLEEYSDSSCIPSNRRKILAEFEIQALKESAEESSSKIEHEIQDNGPLEYDNIGDKLSLKEEIQDSQDASLIKSRRKLTQSEEFSAIYECPRCHSKFGQYLVFQRHIFSYNLETITCTRCTDNHSFRRDEYLAHYREIHRYECDICNKRMASSYGFRYHMKMHQNEKKYVCTFEGCTRSFILKVVLKKHMLTHTEPQTYPCHLCDRVFRTSDMQKYHIKHHDGKRNFLCTYCGRTFVQAVHLKYHVSKHIGERSYICELCGKSFLVKPALTKHFKGCSKKHKIKSKN